MSKARVLLSHRKPEPEKSVLYIVGTPINKELRDSPSIVSFTIWIKRTGCNKTNET